MYCKLSTFIEYPFYDSDSKFITIVILVFLGNAKHFEKYSNHPILNGKVVELRLGFKLLRPGVF